MLNDYNERVESLEAILKAKEDESEKIRHIIKFGMTNFTQPEKEYYYREKVQLEKLIGFTLAKQDAYKTIIRDIQKLISLDTKVMV